MVNEGPEKMRGRRKLLIVALRQRLVPALLKMGFEQLPLPKGRQGGDLRIALPLGYMRRISGNDYELLDIQLDKYGAAKFVINVGSVTSSGIDLPWAHLGRDEALASDTPNCFRLYSSAHSMRWFSPRWYSWPFGIESRVARAVDRAVALLPEIDGWFQEGRVGPHMIESTFPIPSKN